MKFRFTWSRYGDHSFSRCSRSGLWNGLPLDLRTLVVAFKEQAFLFRKNFFEVAASNERHTINLDCRG
jgi:hypothetical protein